MSALETGPGYDLTALFQAMPHMLSQHTPAELPRLGLLSQPKSICLRPALRWSKPSLAQAFSFSDR